MITSEYLTLIGLRLLLCIAKWVEDFGAFAYMLGCHPLKPVDLAAWYYHHTFSWLFDRYHIPHEGESTAYEQRILGHSP